MDSSQEEAPIEEVAEEDPHQEAPIGAEDSEVHLGVVIEADQEADHPEVDHPEVAPQEADLQEEEVAEDLEAAAEEEAVVVAVEDVEAAVEEDDLRPAKLII